MKPRVVVTHWIHDEVADYLGSSCELLLNQTRLTLPRGVITERTEGAHAIMVFMPDSLDDEFLSACPNLKVVAAALKGYDNFDVDACTRRGIWFTIVHDLLTVPTAELAIGLLLGLTRRMPEGDRLVRTGQFAGWRPQLYGTGLSGAICGIIGLGAVGKALARRLKGFDVNVLYSDIVPLPSSEEEEIGVRKVSLEELLRNSDFVFPLVPLRRSTFYLINRKTLLLMKRGAFLINVCRGSVVNEEDVADALQCGQIAGYAADVFEMEDWARTDRPSAISPYLIRNMENTFFTPHLGSAVDSVRREIAMEAARNIIQGLNGEVPMGAVNRPVS
ncbi:MAG: phosphonate dehydrogenase [Syntrophobacteraceae bacterium]